MRVELSDVAVRHIAQHGGRLYVWADRRPCCRGTRFIRASTEPPRDTTAFTLVLHKDVELYVWAPGGLLPDELDVGLRGRHRPRVEASWNGCAFLI